jgi:hypothetical protein
MTRLDFNFDELQLTSAVTGVGLSMCLDWIHHRASQSQAAAREAIPRSLK